MIRFGLGFSLPFTQKEMATKAFEEYKLKVPGAKLYGVERRDTWDKVEPGMYTHQSDFFILQGEEQVLADFLLEQRGHYSFWADSPLVDLFKNTDVSQLLKEKSLAELREDKTPPKETLVKKALWGFNEQLRKLLYQFTDRPSPEGLLEIFSISGKAS